MVSQIILFSQPRSGSNLLERLLTHHQPNVDVLSHQFSTSRGKQVQWLLRGDYEDGMGVEERREYVAQVEREAKGWEEKLEVVERQDRILFVHSHPFFPVSPEKMLEYMRLAHDPSQTQTQLLAENFTLLQSSLLLHPNTIPLITIRDPRLTVPSVYRVLGRMDLPHAGGRPMFLVATCNIWNVVLYNFYRANGIEALVIDADEYMTSREFVKEVCAKIGLQGEAVRFEWDACTTATATSISTTETSERDLASASTSTTRQWSGEEIHPMQYASQNTLYESSGVRAGLAAKNLDLDEVVRGWEEEFGDDVGLVSEMVGLAEKHYRWLFERRFTME